MLAGMAGHMHDAELFFDVREHATAMTATREELPDAAAYLDMSAHLPPAVQSAQRLRERARRLQHEEIHGAGHIDAGILYLHVIGSQHESRAIVGEEKPAARQVTG